jgi:hypothetical protein
LVRMPWVSISVKIVNSYPLSVNRYLLIVNHDVGGLWPNGLQFTDND